jgi:hypothetical protein
MSRPVATLASPTFWVSRFEGGLPEPSGATAMTIARRLTVRFARSSLDSSTSNAW